MELGALVAASPYLVGRHRADGHPVLVVPGLSGGNGWSAILRGYLRAVGHSVYAPRFATTKARDDVVVRRLSERVDELARRHGRPVSLVGWSVGGALVRRVAADRPLQVRQVITLGTPLDGTSWHVPPAEPAGVPPRVPMTAIYSRSDGIFDWRRCLQPESPIAENVEVFSSHLGMASNPLALHVVADRLSQPPGRWRPFDPVRSGWAGGPGPGGAPIAGSATIGA
jgi:pimeloyl-ACP methyl ester carboxylesterase